MHPKPPDPATTIVDLFRSRPSNIIDELHKL
jgi:hypothetical protein